MRRLLPAVFALCLCLCVVSQGWSAGDGASKVAGAIGSVSPAPAGGSAAAAAATSAVPASDAPAEAAPSSVAEAPARPIPDVPPPGWTEDQLADLRKLEIQLRHKDTHPVLWEKTKSVYGITMLVWDANASEKDKRLCVREMGIETDMGFIGTAYAPGQCAGYEPGHLSTAINVIPTSIHIRRAWMDVAPYPDAPDSAVLYNLDAMPALRAVPLPSVVLTTSNGPLPPAPPEGPPLSPNKHPRWPAKLRLHLAAAGSDTRHPERLCYGIYLIEMPMESSSFSRIFLRTNIGDFKDSGEGLGYYARLCAPGGTDRIVIEQATVWKGKKPINAAPLLVRQEFSPLPFITDNGPLPPPAAGMYPPLPRRYTLGKPVE